MPPQPDEEKRRHNQPDNGEVAQLAERGDLESLRAALRQSDERLNNVLQSIADAFIVLSPDWRFLYINDQAARIFESLGILASDLIGKDYWAVFPDALGTAIEHQFRRAMNERVPVTFENFYPRSNAWFEVRIFPTNEGLSIYFQNITDRRAVIESLRDSEQRLRAVFDQAAVGIAMVELDGRITEVNQRFSQILGYEPDELCTMTVLTLTHPDDIELTRINIRRLIDREITNYSMEKRYLCKDGGLVWSLTSVARYQDAEGNITKLIGVIEDITARKNAEAAQAVIALENSRLYEQLKKGAEEREKLLTAEREAREEIERVCIQKDEFLANLSHELRTPLTAILGWSHLLMAAKPGSADVKRGLETISRNAQAQRQLIEDLLDMSRIISGKLRLDVQRVDLAAVIDAAVESVKPSVDAKGIRLHTILDPNAGPVSGDPSRLQQVFWNLLSNSVKFTPRGGKLDIVLQRVDSHLQITVSDSGQGITADFLPFVFDRFRQSDASTTRGTGGLGLGLSITKHLIELHGGSVRVSSDGEGKGATFILQLPLAPVLKDYRGEHPERGVSPILAKDEMRLAGVKVLVVDDEPDSRELVKQVLISYGADVATAAGAIEGIEALKKHRPDVVVSDIGMPMRDGYQFIADVRSLSADEGRNTPAIALTAFARSEDRTRAMLAGYQMHMSKPIEPEELVVTVGSLAGRVRRKDF